MTRYIDAELLEVDLWDNPNAWKDDEKGYTVEQVESIPTADVQEVKHGHWVKPDYPINQLFHIHVDTECKNCGAYGNSGMNYCYHCGTKMDEEVR